MNKKAVITSLKYSIHTGNYKLYVFDITKEPTHNNHWNQTTLVAVYGFDSIKRMVHKNNLFGNQITVVVVYVFDSQKRKGIRLHSLHRVVLIY